MFNQVLGALMAVLFALSGWALVSINSLQIEMGKIQTAHVSSEMLHQLQRQVDRLELITQSQIGPR